MSQEIKDSLWYDFNQSLFVVKTMLPNVKNGRDYFLYKSKSKGRENVTRWLKFLKNSGKTVDEMKLRNDFMYYLVLGVQEGKLKPPFDKPPQNAPLVSMVALLPGPTDHDEFENLRNTNSQDTIDETGSSRKKPAVFRRSPDGGEFLAAQPIPEVGVFCYLAVVTKKRNSN